ncbi:MAG TPA: DUF4157 domain-containing protein [Burkholderiales bacterium]|nr:DUF4157 domain-containing protein [Burkholderiales bacterium]
MKVAVRKVESTAARPAASVHVLRPTATPASAQLAGAWPVSSANDPAEREADATARKVVRMPLPASAAMRPGAAVARRAEGSAPPTMAAGVTMGAGAGTPLPANVRSFMEPRLRADLGRVRVHTDERAATLSRQLNARAFTVGSHVFFARDRFRPDTDEGRELIAHELAHTIQQRAVVQRKEEARVEQRVPERAQRLGLDDILDGLAELAANVPGFTLLTLIIGRNPINMRAVDRSAVNILRGFMGLVPGGEMLFQVLDRYGVVQRLGDWISQQARMLGLDFQGIRDAFTRFTDSLSWTDIFSPGDVWRRARDIFSPTIARIRDIVTGLVSQAIAWLKDTFMQPLSEFCREIPGYGLVTVLLGRDPFTDAPVARTPLNVVRAFAEFIPGGTEKVDQLVESRALERAYQWFITETQARNLTWARVTGTFARAWNSLQLEDVLHPVDTMRRMINLFRPLLVDLVGFAGAALMKLLELIYEAAMGAGGTRILAILQRARATFITIIRDPVGFLRNLMRAVGQGIRQFMANILVHLRDGVIAWLTGPVAEAGIQMPERWDLRGIIWFVLQILGLTWDRVRQKLVRLMGERTVAMLESGFQLLQDVRERGLVQALRDRVTEFFGSLREAALGAIRSFIQQRLVMAGIQQLLSLLTPVGAIIQAIIKTYTTIQFFIQRINQILDLVESIVNSIAAIASGAIASAANFVERTMARTIPVILDFLARFIGLGDVGAQVQATIRGIQARVDQMLDRAVDWIRRQAAGLASRALGGDPNAPPEQRLTQAMEEAGTVVNRYAGQTVGAIVLNPLLAAIRIRHRLTRLEVVLEGGTWTIEGEVNPRRRRPTTVRGTGAGNFTTRINYYPANANRGGTRMVANPLGPEHPRGSSPSAAGAPAIWNQVNIRRSGPRLYVLGHLLNERLGGAGDTSANLTPISFSMNSRHYSGAEQNVVNNIGSVANPRWFYYEVRVVYPASRRTIGAADRARGVVDDEGLLASSFECEWYEQQADPANPARLMRKPGGVASSASITHDIPPYPDT